MYANPLQNAYRRLDRLMAKQDLHPNRRRAARILDYQRLIHLLTSRC